VPVQGVDHGVELESHVFEEIGATGWVDETQAALEGR